MSCFQPHCSNQSSCWFEPHPFALWESSLGYHVQIGIQSSRELELAEYSIFINAMQTMLP